MSTQAVFTLTHAGPLTTVQDRGRFGLLRYGVTESGPMDRTAFAVAQAALGNPPDAVGIETTIGGMSLRCEQGAVTLASAGGGFRVDVDGKPVGAWGVFTVREGQTVNVKPGFWGSWTYLAFAGQMTTPTWLGSAATHFMSGFGGGVLKEDQRIVIENAELRAERELPLPAFCYPNRHVRVVLGPQDRYFDPETIARFLSQPYMLSNDYDRMGVRLKGQRLPVQALDIPSEALSRGSVQVPGHGDPIILLADHQPTGGYPKIATLVSADQDSFVQLRSREHVSFRAVTADEAVLAARSRRTALTGYLDALQRR